MSDASAPNAPEGAVAEAEAAAAAEQAAMAEVQAAAAAAMEAARVTATAMGALAQAVGRWQAAASSASNRRREGERHAATLLKRMNSNIQKMQKWMEERTVTQSVEKNKRLPNVVDQTTTSIMPVADQQDENTAEHKRKEKAGTKRTGECLTDSGIHSATPTKNQRTSENDGIPTPLRDSHTQPTSSNLNNLSTALEAAVKKGKLETLSNYFQLGVNPNDFQYDNGNTLLHMAAERASYKILKALITIGKMDGDAVNSAGQTALHVAASMANGSNCVKVLLENKATINMQDVNGDTPLHYAGRGGHKKIWEKLIKHKADPNISNNAGEIPFLQNATGSVSHLSQSETLISTSADDYVCPSSLVSTSLDPANKIKSENEEIYVE